MIVHYANPAMPTTYCGIVLNEEYSRCPEYSNVEMFLRAMCRDAICTACKNTSVPGRWQLVVDEDFGLLEEWAKRWENF